MIRQNNPAIDAAELSARVRAGAAAAAGRTSAPVLAAPVGADALERAKLRLRLVSELLDDVQRRAEIALAHARPRVAVPRRFARYPLFAAPLRALIALHNYAFKTQREIDVEQNASLVGITYALREVVSLQRMIVQRSLASDATPPT